MDDAKTKGADKKADEKGEQEQRVGGRSGRALAVEGPISQPAGQGRGRGATPPCRSGAGVAWGTSRSDMLRRSRRRGSESSCRRARHAHATPATCGSGFRV